MSGYLDKLLESLRNEDGKNQRERHKTVDLITEYNHFTWECNHLATFPPPLETEHENLNAGVL